MTEFVGTELVAAVLTGDSRALDRSLAAETAFNSPIRRYTDRADVLHLLGLLAEVLPDGRVERTWHGREGAATMISAQLEQRRLEGVVEELHDSAGRVREVTLMLRPHSAMMPAIRAMAAVLDAKPLPSAHRG
jgi:hypothetical protein